MESIAAEEGEAVVVIGSSILQYATDGLCIGQHLDDDNTKVYNLAIGGDIPLHGNDSDSIVNQHETKSRHR